MYDAEGKMCVLTQDRKVSSVMAEVAQSYELRILISVVRFAKSTKNKLFKITVWQHDGFTVYIERNSEKVRQEIEKMVQQELKRLNIFTKLEFKEKYNDKNEIVPTQIEGRRKVNGKYKEGGNKGSAKKKKERREEKGRNKKSSPFVSHYINSTEKILGEVEKPSPNLVDFIKLNINENQDKKAAIGEIVPTFAAEENVSPIETGYRMSPSKGSEIDGRVDTADLGLTA